MRLVEKQEFLKLVARCDLIYVQVKLNYNGDATYVRITKVSAQLLANSADRINVTTNLGSLYIGNT